MVFSSCNKNSLLSNCHQFKKPSFFATVECIIFYKINDQQSLLHKDNYPLIIISTVSRPPITLFPKCFSSFPHGTCSLSVSCLYLALDDAYHPFQAAFPNNLTRQNSLESAHEKKPTGFSPSLMLFSKRLAPCQNTFKITAFINYNSFYRIKRFQFQAFPTSFAITTGILVSFFSSAY